jgi:cytochrome b
MAETTTQTAQQSDPEASQAAVPRGGGAPGLQRLKVWDPWVRAFHWLLVIGLVLAWYSAEYGFGGLGKTWHMRIGTAVLGLIVFRVLWGLVGSQTARFSHFVKGPGTVRGYLKSLRRRDPTPIGHNPLGGWAVVALLLLAAAQPITGLFASDDILASGYLANDVPPGVQDAIGGLHKDLFWVLLGFVGLHVVVTVAYLPLKRENLIRWMVTGRRPAPASWREPWFASPLRALACVAVAAGVAVAIPLIWG